ncbi:myosin-2 heavy chain isoform X1 [Xiphophorus couchianus]|uniref:myosin-2 heavy chain isoform X1 n=1 Tax=Xiphophorus couchianus TaxID=32473 RepID=UPI001016D9D9|nr:myosin-2 heavy chain-like isoform X1 [Xiphophorus couchianus]XP_027888668.1 myosin-2 heavy chain-like isoform X1 [Xiphophorus couchianus]
MAGHYEEGRETKEISKLLCSDADQKDSNLRLDHLTPRPDHCDLILDAIDQQLDQLQIISPKPKSNVVPTSKNGKNGVARWSFGNMSTDGDLDLDVRQQVRRTGCCSFMEDVGDLNDICADHGDSDSAGEEERETQYTAARRFSDAHEQMKSLSASSNSQQNNRKANSENKDSSEDIKDLIRTSTPVRTSERQLSDCINMKEEVFDRRRKCENEEKKLGSKWIQLKEVELCLSELRQKKKETVRQLEQLSADTTWMQKEKRSLEFVLRNSRYQLQQFQRQTESHLKTVFCWKKQLEELHEELHRATEAGSSPLNRCACQQKQLEKRHQSEEPPNVRVSELQHELGECRIKVGALGEMLAQKELQLTGLQEERDSLQVERDNLMRELQLYRELEEAQVVMQELNLHRQEKDQALKARLIQEHIEEFCSLKRVSGPEGGAAASLCRQLKAQEQELRQLQSNTAQWKQQTAARLAGSFTEQLMADLERCKTTLMRCRTASKMKETSPDRSTMSGAKESQEAVCSHLHHAAVGAAAAHVPSDVSLFQLLCSLQSRVKQLQVENQAFPDTLSFDVSGSFLTTVRGELPKGDF